MAHFLDLRIPEHSYIFGLIQTDGSISEETRNRSKVRIELNRRDRAILEKISLLLPIKTTLSDRDRETNFGPSSTSTLSIYNRSFTNRLKEFGVSAGKKSATVYFPSSTYSLPDYIRGLIDGDGCLGITAKGFPFLGLVTQSSDLAKGFIDFVHQMTGLRKTMNRNKRDNIYNLSLFREHAQKIIGYLYYPGCLCIERKLISARYALAWQRPASMRRVKNKRIWTKEEDLIALNNSPKSASVILERTLLSVQTRLWRIAKLSCHDIPTS